MKPITGKVWLVFDLDNGHDNTCRYTWCFKTKRLALEHIAYQRSFGTRCAELSEPYLFEQVKMKPASTPKSRRSK